MCGRPGTRDALRRASCPVRAGVIVMIKVPGDVTKARATFEAQSDFLSQTTHRSREAGALHHGFAAGDGEIVVIDEWHSREAFEQFFADPAIAKFMAHARASAPPVVEFYEAVEAPGDFRRWKRTDTRLRTTRMTFGADPDQRQPQARVPASRDLNGSCSKPDGAVPASTATR